MAQTGGHPPIDRMTNGSSAPDCGPPRNATDAPGADLTGEARRAIFASNDFPAGVNVELPFQIATANVSSGQVSGPCLQGRYPPF